MFFRGTLTSMPAIEAGNFPAGNRGIWGGGGIPLDSHEIMFHKTLPYRHPVPPPEVRHDRTLKTYQSNTKLTSGGIRLDV